MLSTQHFTRYDRHVEDGKKYEAYATKYPGRTMVLVSPDHPEQPVAALSIARARCRKEEEACVIEKRGEHEFQCMAPNEHGELQFVITNLTHGERPAEGNTFRGKSFVKIDLLAEDVPVQKTNLPHVAYNEVNELLPSQSYVVRSDQRHDQAVLVLKGMVQANGDAPLSVEKLESEGSTSQKTAARVFVHVTASRHFPEIGKLLENAKWVPMDTFVRNVRVSGNPFESSDEEEDFSEEELTQGYGNPRESLQCATKSGTRGVCLSSAAQLFAIAGPEICSARAPTQSEMDKAQAAKIAHGDYRVDVHSSTTTVEYDFSRFARTAVLFSLWPEMHVRHVGHRELRDSALAKMEDAKNYSFEQLVQLLQKIYIEEECCICLTEPPKIVMIPCGHQTLCCPCFAKAPSPLRNCYLCRELVVAARQVPE